MDIKGLPLKVEVLTPTFIGSGNKLLPMEVYRDRNTVKVLKFENLADQLTEKLNYQPERLRELMKNLSLEVGDRRNLKTLDELFRNFGIPAEVFEWNYNLKVEGNLNRLLEIEEFIKTLNGVYIPGSEVKGAFRTAVLYYILVNFDDIWGLFERELRTFLNNSRNWNLKSLQSFILHWENKVFAGKPLRKAFTGRETPNATEDIFKFLQVEDSEKKHPQEVLILKKILLKNTRRPQQVWIESLKEHSTFGIKIYWDSTRAEAFLKTRMGDLDRNLKEFWLNINERKLLEIVNEFTRKLVDFEIERRERANGNRQQSGRNEFEALMARIKKEVLEGIKGTKSSVEILKKLRNENGYLLRLGKFTGRYSHSILVAVKEKNRRLYEAKIKYNRLFSSKTYWEDEKEKPLGFLKIKPLQ